MPTDPVTTPTASGRAPSRSKRGRPGPFPVTVVRPASTKAAALTAVQRDRRSAANQLGHHLTEAARRGIAPRVDEPMGVSLNLVPEAIDIIRAAPALAADPPPDALRIGRDLRGRPVVVVVHADRWSLVLRPAGRCGRTATSAVFLDGYGAGFDLTFIDVTFDHDPSLLGDEWADMVGHVLSIAT